MMERAKTASAPEDVKPKESAAVSSAPSKTDASSDERVQDLERRLDLLGGNEGGKLNAASYFATKNVVSAPTAITAASVPAAAANTIKPSSNAPAKSNPLLVRAFEK